MLKNLYTILSIVSVIMINLSCAQAGVPDIELTLTAPQEPAEVVLNFSDSKAPHAVRCSSHDFPDNPPRAFIGSDNKVWIWASNSQAFQAADGKTFGGFIKIGGSSLNDDFDKGACAPTFVYSPMFPTDANEDVSLASYQNLLWPVEFWANRTNNIYSLTALLHNEFHGQQLTDCASHNLKNCWYANLIASDWQATTQQLAVALDAGNKAIPVMASPLVYMPNQGMQGMAAQTNIILNPQDHFYYLLVLDNASSLNMQTAGMCLFRTSLISDPNAWQGLAEDNSFSIKRNINPYLQTPDARACKHVLPAAYRFGLVYNPIYKVFIALGVNAASEQQQAIYYTVTKDLTNWNWSGKGVVGKILNFPNFMWMTFWTKTKAGDSFDAEGYPSLMDPQSPQLAEEYLTSTDLNFQYVGTTPYLYYVFFHARQKGKNGSSLKDVVRRRLNLSCLANCE